MTISYFCAGSPSFLSGDNGMASATSADMAPGISASVVIDKFTVR